MLIIFNCWLYSLNFYAFLLRTRFCVAGEVKKGKVSGFHNWIQVYLLEKRGQLNYYSHSFNGPVSIHNTDHNVMVYVVICRSTNFIFFLSLPVAELPWCLGDAVPVGRLLQAGRVRSHRLQPRVWLCHLQPLLHRSPWKTVGQSICPMMSSGLWIFSDFTFLLSIIFRCYLSLGGEELVIQTYTWDKSFYGDGKKFIASAFPATPRNWSHHLLKNRQLTEHPACL